MDYSEGYVRGFEHGYKRGRQDAWHEDELRRLILEARADERRLVCAEQERSNP